MKYGIVDHMSEGVNVIKCTCGERLYPDCDMSVASIVEEHDRHVAERHRANEHGA